MLQPSQTFLHLLINDPCILSINTYNVYLYFKPLWILLDFAYHIMLNSPFFKNFLLLFIARNLSKHLLNSLKIHIILYNNR